MTDMFAGGPGGDPYMGLLGMSDPRITLPSGLMGMGPLSQLAYQMAGSPQQGPYASIPVPAAIPGSLPSASAGSSGGSGIMGGLLGTVAKNPKLVSQASNLISGLLGSAPTDASAAAAGAPALASLGADTAAATGATSADIAAANSAWLASQPAATGALYAGAPAAADAVVPAAAATEAAPAASSAGLGAMTGGTLAVAAPLALALYASSTAPVDYGAQWTSNLANAAQQAISQLKSGAPGAADGVAGLLQSLNGVPGMSGIEDQLNSSLQQYNSNVMLQRALAAGFPSVDAMNAAANAGPSLMGRGGPTKGTVRV